MPCDETASLPNNRPALDRRHRFSARLVLRDGDQHVHCGRSHQGEMLPVLPTAAAKAAV